MEPLIRARNYLRVRYTLVLSWTWTNRVHIYEGRNETTTFTESTASRELPHRSLSRIMIESGARFPV